MRSAVTFAVLLASVAAASAQVSPGPLSRPHAHLQGKLSCLRCHGAQGAKGLDALCRECHREIDWSIEHGRGLRAKEGRADCARCHPEHGGAEFDLVESGHGGRARFDHARAGWPLKGEHARTECKDCHAVERFQVSAAAQLYS